MKKGLRNISDLDHDYFMDVAIEEAKKAGDRGDIAIGAVLVHNGKIIDKGSNRNNTNNSKVQHAENMLCIENGSYLRDYGKDCIIYTTAEPCLMCIGTIVMSNIRNIVIGTEDSYMHTKNYIQGHEWLKDRVFNYVVGIRKKECIQLILDYCDEETQKRLLG